MKRLFVSAAFAVLAASAAPVGANADTFVLANDAGGDGFANAIAGGFDLFGADNGAANNTTTLTATAGVAETLTYFFKYTTHDVDGSGFDPAGAIINGVETQLSAALPLNGSNSGSFVFNLAAGDTYGFYVFDTDGVLGRGEILFSTTGVPEPASWAMMLVGFFAIGGAARATRRGKVLASA